MNITNLKSDIDFLCGSTSGTYPVADKVRNMNIAYNDVARVIWESAGGWQFEDTNSTSLPVGYATLVHNQQDYTLPSTAMRVERVEVKDSGGDWVRLKYFDSSEIDTALPEYLTPSNSPLYYDLVGDSLMLYPIPSSANVTLASGLAVYLSRSITEIATTASTSSPGFAAPFHRILSYAAAIDFTQDENQRRFLILQKDRLEKAMKNFYSRRGVENRTAIRPSNKKYWRQYT